jgi:hypothetical protein
MIIRLTIRDPAASGAFEVEVTAESQTPGRLAAAGPA